MALAPSSRPDSQALLPLEQIDDTTLLALMGNNRLGQYQDLVATTRLGVFHLTMTHRSKENERLETVSLQSHTETNNILAALPQGSAFRLSVRGPNQSLTWKPAAERIRSLDQARVRFEQATILGVLARVGDGQWSSEFTHPQSPFAPNIAGLDLPPPTADHLVALVFEAKKITAVPDDVLEAAANDTDSPLILRHPARTPVCMENPRPIAAFRIRFEQFLDQLK